MTYAAVGADQLDAILFDAVDGAHVHAVCADDFHVLANILEAAHETFSSLGMPVQRFVRAASSRTRSAYACSRHESSAKGICVRVVASHC